MNDFRQLEATAGHTFTYFQRNHKPTCFRSRLTCSSCYKALGLTDVRFPSSVKTPILKAAFVILSLRNNGGTCGLLKEPLPLVWPMFGNSTHSLNMNGKHKAWNFTIAAARGDI